MARIVGVDIPNEKRVVISLMYVFGIGKPLSQKILKTYLAEKSGHILLGQMVKQKKT